MTIRVEKQEKYLKYGEFFSYNLTYYQVKILKFLVNYRTNYRWVYPSQDYIARSVGCARKTVQRSIKRLKQLGFHDWINRANRERKKSRQTNLYFLDGLLDPVIYKKLIQFFGIFFKVSLYLLASKKRPKQNVPPIKRCLNKTIYNSDSKSVDSSEKDTMVKKMPHEYDDNPTFQEKKVAIREKVIPEKEFLKREVTESIAHLQPPPAEYVAEQKIGALNLFSQSGSFREEGAIKFASILVDKWFNNLDV